MPNVMPPGLAGYLQAQQMGQQNAASNIGILSRLQQMRNNAQIAPLQAKLLDAQYQGALSKLAQDQRRQQFFSPENTQKYMVGGTIGSQPDPQELQQSADQGTPAPIATPAQPPTINFDRLMQDAAAQGVVKPETYAALAATKQARIDALQTRLYDIQTRSQDRALTLAQQAELAKQADQTKRYLAGLIASSRQQTPPVAVIGPDGKPVLVSREDAIGKTPVSAEKPLTEVQGKSALYGTRAAQSDKILSSLENGISTSGLSAARSLGPMGNFVMSSEQRRVDQAQRDFVNAVLRQESGAAISDAEFANAQKQYFPQPGDDAKTIAQKRANRKMAISGFVRMAGPGGKDISNVASAPLLPNASNPGDILNAADAILSGGK